MAEVAARPWLIAGHAHLLAAALLALATAAGAPLVPGELHLLVAGAGLFLVAGGLAYGFAPPFVKRELLGAWPAHAALVLVLAGDALAAWRPRWGALALGAAYLVFAAHLAASAALGRAWRGGIALFAKDQPFRVGDMVALAFFAVALAGLAISGAVHALWPRGLAVPALAAHALLFALPFFVGVLVFLLPRNAKRPLPGVVLVGAALVVHALAAATLLAALLRPGLTDYRQPAAGLAMALGLFAVAIVRLRFPRPPGKQVERARPFLLAALSLAVLAAIAAMLGLAPAGPTALFPVAGYAFLLLAAVLALAATLLGAPILVNAVPRAGAWAKGAAALAVATLFLLVPSALVAAAVAALGAGLAAWGLWPMRQPRRDCD